MKEREREIRWRIKMEEIDWRVRETWRREMYEIDGGEVVKKDRVTVVKKEGPQDRQTIQTIDHQDNESHSCTRMKSNHEIIVYSFYNFFKFIEERKIVTKRERDR